VSLSLSVILCTRDPHRGRLARTLAALSVQSFPSDHWELILVDNGSTPSLEIAALPPHPANVRLVSEPRPGLTLARLAGIAAARGELLVFVDDDNVLAPDFLANALDAFAADGGLTAAGGPVRPEFETPPPAWTQEFQPLLALRDLGPQIRRAPGGPNAPWPDFAPVGAGLCMRRAAAQRYAEAVRRDPRRAALDRRDGELTSGGDNDLIFTALLAGGAVAYLPQLSLVHLIPTARLTRGYLARLNFSIQRSWVRVLDLHGVRPWPPIPRWTLPLRVARARWRSRAWRGPAEFVRFHGLRGRLAGQADLAV
jgi:glycosyltransferase involved in cell wall biosynthesis